ncbi:hypothetical protein PR202_gb00063 [Eleusine coracana subsp. coracana]|uniref:Uncharacterized protein n=1 Tax=Eleusine coracana subsp. coracana TaxID=191504 RepID=A0AAV5DSX9_ELECO|nr:hypothetical protein PR202_gb00063 [Eleusine coracana subsp. coracana]
MSIVVDDLRTGNKRYNDFRSLDFRLLDVSTTAESLAFNHQDKGPYTGVYYIFKWVFDNKTVWGRLLGVQFFHKTGELYIADVYLSLMKVGPRGGVAKLLATEADDVFHLHQRPRHRPVH